MTSDRALARWQRASKRMSHPYHPVGLWFDWRDGQSRRRSARRNEDESKGRWR